MKPSVAVKLLSSAVLSLWLVNGCADNQAKTESASQASPEAIAAIASANAAIKAAKANNWIWRDTEQFAKDAQAAADSGDSKTAIMLANKARREAEDAVRQYQYETAHPRGL